MLNPAACTTLENVDVECTHCGVQMSSHVGSGGKVRYFQCPTCQRWMTSVYTEVFRADTKMRTRRPTGETPSVFSSVKDRLERWLRALDDQDPYRMLGVTPLDTDQAIRDRYRELARQHHPDRGGDVEQMRRINDAYDRVMSHRTARATVPSGLPSGA